MTLATATGKAATRIRGWRLHLSPWRGRPPSAPALALAVVTAMFMALPLVYVLYRGLTGGVDTWQRLWDIRLPALLIDTIQLTVAVSVLAIVIGGGLAWIVVRTDVPLRGLWSWLLAMPLVVPPYVGAFVYIAYLGPRGWVWEWTDGAVTFPEFYGFRGATLVLTLFTYPYVFLTASAALRNLNPSFSEAAAAAGAGRLRRFFTVTVPLIRPALMAGGLLVALYALSDFGTVTLLREHTFTWAIYRELNARFDRSAAAALSSVLVLLTLLLLFAQSMLQGRARYHQDTAVWRRQNVIALGRWRWPALAIVLIVLTLSLLLPVGTLVYWTVAGLRDESTAADVWSTSSGGLLGYLQHSLVASSIAATATSLIAIPLAALRARHPGPVSGAIERVAQAGYALPGIVVALSVVFVLNYGLPGPLGAVGLLNDPITALYGTVAALIMAYVLRFFPQAYQSTSAAYQQVSPALEEAARTMGRPQWRATAETTLPLIAPGLLMGWALVFITTLKELPATLLLRPAGFDTLPVRIWIQASEGVFELAAPAALLLIACSAPLLYVVVRRSRDQTMVL